MLLFNLGFLVLLTTVLCELAAKRGWLPYWVSRKILHVVAVGSCAVAGYYADALGHRTLLIGIVAIAEVALLGLIGCGGLMREESGRRPWGIVWFPLAFLILLVAIPRAEIIGFSMAVLAICDPAATVMGKLFRRLPSAPGLLDDHLAAGRVKPTSTAIDKYLPPYHYQLTGDQKSLAGNAGFLVSCLLLILYAKYLILSRYLPEETDLLFDSEILFITFGLSVILTAGEALGSKGLDNLIVPLLTAVLLSLNLYDPETSLLFAILLVTVPLFCYITVKRKSLSSGGAVTAGLIGVLITLSAGPSCLIPLLFFFVSSSLIGKFFPAHSVASDAKQKQPRDATQVLANGAIYTFIAVYFTDYVEIGMYPKQPSWLYLLITAAVATADTWSSELGQYFRRPTYDLVKWRRVPTGLSGGVSLPGTLAGLSGAALIASLGCWLMPEPSLPSILMIVAFGFGGMLLDSVIGSLFQATYRNPATGNLSDTKGENGQLASGYAWMTNDLVNFLAILLTVLLFVLAQLLYS